MNTKNVTMDNISLATENDLQKTNTVNNSKYVKIEELQPRERSRDGLSFKHEVSIVPPDTMIEEIAPLEVVAEYYPHLDKTLLDLVIYVHADYNFDKVAIVEEKKLDARGALKIDIIFPKPAMSSTSLKSRYEFIPYKVKYTLEFPDPASVKSVITYLQSSNPRTSRGTVTTVRRPM